MKRFVSLMLVICVVFVTMSACTAVKSDNESVEAKTDEELIEERIESFLSAYNDGNFNAVLDCLDSKTRNIYKIAVKFSENIGLSFLKKMSGLDFDFSISELFGSSVEMISDGDILTAASLQIYISDDENATVDTTLNYKVMQSESSEDCTFIMVKENGDWFIKNITSR